MSVSKRTMQPFDGKKYCHRCRKLIRPGQKMVHETLGAVYERYWHLACEPQTHADSAKNAERKEARQ